ncbi:MAG: hypothetical protein KA603_01140 [Azonexus sp.]|jgi:lysozyme|nr:hypothetical protein [Betaproteobacteria bacterium]MBK8918792.1 hypothetical protein [Betaproteobacteria bacterium]MBP6034724.1 hypothetical protein [Azonexus sp.]MBP6905264.1 hypothetical protein [Azonexus sp.]
MPSKPTNLLPASGRPKITEAELLALLAKQPKLELSDFPLAVIGLRGYYANTMGATPNNERSIYDDAIVLYVPNLNLFQAFNGNTDPSSYREGSGFVEGTRGMAVLQPGVWPCYRFDIHGGKRPHPAICQRAGPVRVLRDGSPPYDHVGNFGINIHKGGNFSTSSHGCQTLPPGQWDEFIAAAHDAGDRLFGRDRDRQNLLYVLIDCS